MQLLDAFEIAPGDIVAIVGGGGKTTLMNRLAREVAAAGGRAIATGTTLFTPPPHAMSLPLVVESDEDELVRQAIAQTAGSGAIITTTGHGAKGRLLAVGAETPSRIVAAAPGTYVFVEADGSRGRPFKAPAEHEPVIPGGATLVVAVAGISALGTPLDDEHVHRADRVIALTGAAPGSQVTPGIIATVLAHPLGGRKGVVAGMRFAVMINQVTPQALDDARHVAALLRQAGVGLIVLAQAREQTPVVDVIR